MALDDHSVIVIGGGPAGLTAAYEAVRQNIRPIVLEKSDKVGGLARTEIYKGYRFDIGGHRFFTKIKEVQHLWEEMLNGDFLKVRRLSRIYHQSQFFNYPLSLFNVLKNLGIIESLLILFSYLKAQIWPCPEEETFEQWVINRFGSRLYKKFFKSYTEKVWGISCDRIQADWAAQRIKGLSLLSAVLNAIFEANETKTLISEFHYPTLGVGMMWEHYQKVIENLGGVVHCNAEVIQLRREGHQIKNITVQKGDGAVELTGKHILSSMPLSELITKIEPLPPKEIVCSASKLTYRASILIGLIIEQKELFPDQWIYIHNLECKVGRIQNYKNWSAAMVPDLKKTSIGMEYFCREGDGLWTMSDGELLDLATRELSILELARIADVVDGVVFRQPKAYPVYDRDYRRHLNVIQIFLKNIQNLQTIGRNGLHRYNNQDHSMLAAKCAVDAMIRGGEGKSAIWRVNAEDEYHEQIGTVA
jgi:protoporphyrinogen oxidase